MNFLYQLDGKKSWKVSIAIVRSLLLSVVTVVLVGLWAFNQQDSKLPYARYYNLLLVTNRSWILTINKDKVFIKNLLENKEMVFKNGLGNIQAAAYNGARTVGR